MEASQAGTGAFLAQARAWARAEPEARTTAAADFRARAERRTARRRGAAAATARPPRAGPGTAACARLARAGAAGQAPVRRGDAAAARSWGHRVRAGAAPRACRRAAGARRGRWPGAGGTSSPARTAARRAAVPPGRPPPPALSAHLRRVPAPAAVRRAGAERKSGPSAGRRPAPVGPLPRPARLARPGHHAPGRPPDRRAGAPPPAAAARRATPRPEGASRAVRGSASAGARPRAAGPAGPAGVVRRGAAEAAGTDGTQEPPAGAEAAAERPSASAGSAAGADPRRDHRRAAPLRWAPRPPRGGGAGGADGRNCVRCPLRCSPGAPLVTCTCGSLASLYGVGAARAAAGSVRPYPRPPRRDPPASVASGRRSRHPHCPRRRNRRPAPRTAKCRGAAGATVR